MAYKYVKSTVKLNMQGIKKLNDNAVKALEMTAEALHTDIVQAEVMPFDSGELQQEATFVDVSDSKDGRARIVSSTPYARRLYFHPEYDFQKYENAFAGGEWFNPWLKGGGVHQDDAKKYYSKILKRLNRS